MPEYKIKEEKGRKEFVQLVMEQDEDLDELLENTTDEVRRLIAKCEKRDGELDKKKFDKYIPYIFGFWALNFTNLLVRHNEKVTELVTEEGLSSIEVYSSDVFRSSIKRRSEQLLENLEKNFLSRRMFKDGVSVEWRIKTIENSYVKTVQDIVKKGLDEGQSAFQIAKEIDNIIKPRDYKKWVSPYDFYRATAGKSHKIASKVRRAGSVSYNSFRIARTEINETYRLHTVQLHEDQPWVEGFKWNLSPAHPPIDCECEDLDGHIFKTEKDLPHTHPNCFCWITPVLVSPDEIT